MTSQKLNGDISTKIPPSAWKTLVILSLIATMAMYAETMLVPALPDLIKDFSISYGSSSWILTTFLISGAIMTPISGKLSDMYGRKKVLLIILAIYAAGVTLGGFATNFYLMIVVRAMQGIGMSMFPIAFGIVREQFPPAKMAIGQGIITSMFGAGSVIGLLVGGHIIENYGWQATFFSIIPIVLALLFVVKKFIKLDKPQSSSEDKQNKTNKKVTIDIKGAITLAIAIASFLIALTMMENVGSNYVQILSLLIIGAVSITAFTLIEKKAASPMIDFKILLHKTILPANIMMVIVGLSMFMVFQTIPVLIRSPVPLGFGGDPIATTYVQLPFSLVLMIFGPLSGFIISRMGSSKPVIMGSTASLVAFFSLYFFHSAEYLISADLAILAVGLSLSAVGITNIVMLATPKQFLGSSLGTTSLIRIVGSSIGPAMAGMYMGMYHTTIKGIPDSFPAALSYDMIFLTAAIFSVVALMLSIFLNKKAAASNVEMSTQ
ncbi:MAG: MFS transporter [Nitrosotalea sp.]